MTRNDRPPKRLPKGFREVWSAVSRAQAKAGTRAELSRRLGVSTHTLQSLLADGDVPRFGRETSTRKRLAWVRTLARLAERLGGDPRRWIESAGIEWTDDVSATARENLRKMRRPRENRPHDDAFDTPDAPVPLPRRLFSRDTPVARELSRPLPRSLVVGVASNGPWTSPLVGDTEGFLQSFARRWVDAVDSEIEPRFHFASAEDLARSLSDPAGSIDLALGISESAATRSRGLRFLPIPGWSVRLAALFVSPGRRTRVPPTWRELAESNDAEFPIYVLAGSPAVAAVRSIWNVEAARFVVLPEADAASLARDLAAAARVANRALVFVADEWTSAETSNAAPDDFTEIRDDEGDAPRFSMGAFLAAGASDEARVLLESLKSDLFGASRAATARLYGRAALAAGLAARERVRDLEAPTFARPLPFDEADAEFRRAFARALVTGVWEHRAHIASNSEPAFRTVLAFALAVTPPEWRDVVEREAESHRRHVLGQSAAAPPAHHCGSCSQSLLVHPGPSSEYCRYCSDEDGRLRPREEVHELIAGWMEWWQPALTRNEARRRAELYMNAMPAWADASPGR